MKPSPFGTVKQCVKCGSRNFTRLHGNSNGHRYIEVIHCTCSNCKYTWEEWPLDHEEINKPIKPQRERGEK